MATSHRFEGMLGDLKTKEILLSGDIADSLLDDIARLCCIFDAAATVFKLAQNVLHIALRVLYFARFATHAALEAYLLMLSSSAGRAMSVLKQRHTAFESNPLSFRQTGHTSRPG